MNILLAEDLESDYLLFKQYLKLTGINQIKLFWAKDFKEILQSLKLNKIDLVFLDLNLDKFSDLDGLKKLRKTFSSIPIVILTGLDDINVGIRAIKFGAQDYLVKGEYNEVELRKTIYYTIERNKLLIELQNAKEALDRSKRRELQALIDGQEKERERIAQDLHDGLGQVISLLKLKISSSDEEQINGETKDYLIGLIDIIIKEYRAASHNLLPPYVEDAGLIFSLTKLCKEYNEFSPINVNLKTSGNLGVLNRKDEVQILRIIKELLVNAVKHANPQNITIEFSQRKKALYVKVSDDGKGLTFSKTGSPKNGIGLKNIQSRARALNGNVKFVKNYPKGTTVVVKLKV